MHRGFSLIEVLVALAVFTILAMLATAALFLVTANAAKARVKMTIKRNGDQAMQIMERHLMVAQSLDSCPVGSWGSTVSFTDQYGNPATFSCLSLTDSGCGISGNNIASGSGYIALTNPCQVYVQDCNIFQCDTNKSWLKIAYTLQSNNYNTGRSSEIGTASWQSQISIRFQ
jgi:prepilin-type N-terminal cleavage/methylation domain-containing protein